MFTQYNSKSDVLVSVLVSTERNCQKAIKRNLFPVMIY